MSKMKAGDRIRVNIRCNAVGKVRKEQLNGRDVIIVPSATMPDDVVMNDILYPAAEIEKSFMGLDRTPAPLGHPQVAGMFVSARDPEGINISWVGAFNTNVRREKGRVYLDKVIDVARANQSDDGKRLLKAIDKGEAIHTSTGVFCNLHDPEDGQDCEYVARDLDFDHDAILLDEEGAATPEQGVGMMVNSKGEHKEIPVVNSIVDIAERDLDWAVEHLSSALMRREKASMIEQMKAAILELFGQKPDAPDAAPTEDSEGKPQMADAVKAPDEELSAQVQALAEKMDKLTTMVEGMAERNAADAAEKKAAEEVEANELRAKIVKANLLDEESAKELTLKAARALAKKAEPGKAAGIKSNYNGKSGDDDEFEGYSLNAFIKPEKKEAVQ